MLTDRDHYNIRFNRRSLKSAVVLITVLVMMVLLSISSFFLSKRLLAKRRQDNFLVNYTQARYSCDSAVKYALATMTRIKPVLIDRPNEPDFSDLFRLNEIEYKEFIEEWMEYNILEQQEEFKLFGSSEDPNDSNDTSLFDLSSLFGSSDMNMLAGFDMNETTDPNLFEVRGPYGPVWPLITPPIEFEIATSKIRIEIEDENAKYPIGWLIINDLEKQQQAEAGFDTFFGWMWQEGSFDPLMDAGIIKEQLIVISEDIKPFKVKFRVLRKQVKQKVKRVVGRRTVETTRTVIKNISANEQFLNQAIDFAQIYHTSLIDRELLALPTVISEDRTETALKYLAIWGSAKVNINTAPRHVLEATFAFGGDQADLANDIILQRRIKPFKDIDDLKERLYQYTQPIENCKDLIVTESEYFTIRITATDGLAKASAVIAINKQSNNAKVIAVLAE